MSHFSTAFLGVAPAHLAIIALLACGCGASSLPIVVNTWAFTNATDAAWRALLEQPDAAEAALEAVVQVACLPPCTAYWRAESAMHAGTHEETGGLWMHRVAAPVSSSSATSLLDMAARQTKHRKQRLMQ